MLDKILNIAKEVKRAKAILVGGAEGEAEFIEYELGNGNFVVVNLSVKADPGVLSPGLHGVHIHEKGVCEEPFQTAGGHFDPGPAGNTDPDVNHPYHMGDLPNIEIQEDGSGKLLAVTNRITLSEGPLCILSGEGTSLMLHGHQDQCVSGPTKSGVSGGPRFACGIIKAT